MSETPLRGREEGKAAREKQANFCLSWQSLLLIPPSPPPLSLLSCTGYIIMLKFVVPHNIFSVFHHLCLLFGLELRLGFSVYPPTPRTPPLPVLVLHVFLWPRSS